MHNFVFVFVIYRKTEYRSYFRLDEKFCINIVVVLREKKMLV